jgi:hypothetical protein
MLQIRAFGPGFVLGLVTVGALVAEPARESGSGWTGEAAGELGALPASQLDFDTDVASTISQSFVNMPNSQVTINNGTSTRNVVVTFSAEARVLDTDGLRDSFVLAFRIDSNLACTAGGPQVFTNSIAVETHTAVHVFSIGPGTHTIRPCWRVLPDDDSGQSIQVFSRTLIAEGRTR